MHRAREIQNRLVSLCQDALGKRITMDTALAMSRDLTAEYSIQDLYGALAGLIPYIYDEVARQSPKTAKVLGLIVHEASLQVNDKTARPLLIAMSGGSLGKLLVDLKEYEQAIPILKFTLTVLEELPTEARLQCKTVSLLHLGMAQHRTGNKDSALKCFYQALAIAQSAGLRAEIPAIFFNLANLHVHLGEREQAREYYRLAGELSRDLPSGRIILALSLLESAKFLDFCREADVAKEMLKEALPLFETQGDQLGACNTLGLLARVEEIKGNYDAAIIYYEKALVVGTDSAKELLLSCVNSLVRCYVRKGHPEGAFPWLEALLVHAEETHNDQIKLQALRGLAGLMFAGEDPERMICLCNQGVEVATKLGDNESQILFLGFLADMYARLGQDAEANQFWSRAIEAMKDDVQLPSESERVKVQQIGPLRIITAEFDGSENEREKTVQELMNQYPIAFSPQMGAIYKGGYVDRHRGARFFFKQGYRLGMSPLFWQVGLEFLGHALSLYLAGNHIWEAQEVVQAIGRCQECQGDTNHALESYEQSISLLERFRGNLHDDEFRVSYLARRADAFYDVIRLHMETKNHVAAFNYVERGKARGLVDLLLEREGMSPKPSKTFTLPEVQEQLLDEETALLEYALGSETSFLWIVTKNAWEVHILPPASEIQKKVIEWNETFFGDTGNHMQAAYDLYCLLIQPAEKFIKDKMRKEKSRFPRRLIIVPDDMLYFLPFELLITEPPEASQTIAPKWVEYAQAAKNASKTPYLLRRYSIVYAPSATALATVKRERDKAENRTWEKDFIGFAPVEFRSAKALPNTEHEIKGIASLFLIGKSAVRVRGSVTKRAVQSDDLKRYRYVHFATHGHMDKDKPQFCGLLFPDTDGDSLLHTFEIFDLELNADLVTLSACDTGLGKVVLGEGMMGLMRAFFHAGVSSVCVSLWKVDDKSTADLMQKFYRYLIEGKMNKAEALRQAKLEMIQEGQWAHPYYWAPFVLVGDWQ